MTEQHLRMADAARYLGIHRNTLWRLCNRGEGPPCFRLGSAKTVIGRPLTKEVAA